MLSDVELVRAAQAGDAACVGVLFERHRAAMRAVARSRLGFGPEAEDVVQDAAVVALYRIGELRDPAAAGAWLQAIVRNACRARFRTPRVELRADLGLLATSEVPSPEVVLDRRVLRYWASAAG